MDFSMDISSWVFAVIICVVLSIVGLGKVKESPTEISPEETQKLHQLLNADRNAPMILRKWHFEGEHEIAMQIGLKYPLQTDKELINAEAANEFSAIISELQREFAQRDSFETTIANWQSEDVPGTVVISREVYRALGDGSGITFRLQVRFPTQVDGESILKLNSTLNRLLKAFGAIPTWDGQIGSTLFRSISSAIEEIPIQLTRSQMETDLDLMNSINEHLDAVASGDISIDEPFTH